MRYFGLIGIVTIYRHNNISLLSPQHRCYSKSPRLICKDFVFKFDASNFFFFLLLISVRKSSNASSVNSEKDQQTGGEITKGTAIGRIVDRNQVVLMENVEIDVDIKLFTGNPFF